MKETGEQRMDMSQYRDLFIAETKEHLSGMGECVVRLENDPAGKDAIDSLFRFAHSIKGMAASMGYDVIADLSHSMEDLMDRVRKGDITFAATTADLLMEGVELLHEMVSDVESDGEGGWDASDLIRRLKGCRSSEKSEMKARMEPTASESGFKVDTQQNIESGAPDDPEIRNRPVDLWQTVRVRTDILDNLINVTGELVTTKHRLMKIGAELGSEGFDEAVAGLSKLLRELHSEVMRVRLMPFAAIAERFPGVVRQLARKSGKDVSLEIVGKEIEIDRGILEQLADPLVHLLRNAVDHGMETHEERLSAGKPGVGKIRLEVTREKDQVVITVSDDGRGMDPAKLIESAIERRLITPDQRESISPGQAFMLTCIPGFSTAQQVTDISGRGVGMDVVRCSIQSLGGRLSIDSTVGLGTRISVQVPVSVAIIQILLVRCSSLTVGFPIVRIQRTLELRRSEVTKRGKQKVFYLDGEAVPLLSLNRLLGARSLRLSGEYIPTIVTELRGKKVGLVVDGFEGQQDVFLKPLGRPLEELRGAAGAAILGDGRVVVILDTTGLV
jgi:two-component system chemotaxis sensor kinase CheA